MFEIKKRTFSDRNPQCSAQEMKAKSIYEKEKGNNYIKKKKKLLLMLICQERNFYRYKQSDSLATYACANSKKCL